MGKSNATSQEVENGFVTARDGRDSQSQFNDVQKAIAVSEEEE